VEKGAARRWSMSRRPEDNPDKLTTKEAIFVAEVMKGKPFLVAAISAGYSEEKDANRLMARPAVAKALITGFYQNSVKWRQLSATMRKVLFEAMGGKNDCPWAVRVAAAATVARTLSRLGGKSLEDTAGSEDDAISLKDLAIKYLHAVNNPLAGVVINPEQVALTGEDGIGLDDETLPEA
jgi:hypothetical protein